MKQTTTITVTLNEKETHAFRLFCARTTLNDFKAVADDIEQAYDMRDAVFKIWTTLRNEADATNS